MAFCELPVKCELVNYFITAKYAQDKYTSTLSIYTTVFLYSVLYM